jgi:outer membrane protein OmpA-like peptidoglycan-associated protein
MTKKIKITEHQLSLIVNHINENKDSELLEEGIKEWMLVGLMTLGSISGIKAQTGEVSSDHIKAAELVQDRLQSGDKELVKYFDKADIELNKDNLKELLDVDNDDIKTFKTKYVGTAKGKIKQGYAIERVEVKRDTLISELPAETTLDTTLNVDLSGNLFDEGKFELNSQTVSELTDIIKVIELNGGTVNSVVIESSTDKQRISPELEPKLVDAIGKGGNEGLSTLRNGKVRDYIVNLGVDSSVVKQDIKWEQGEGENNAETPQDPSARYVRVVIDVSYDVAGLPSDSTVGEVTEKVYFVLVKKAEKTGSKKSGGKSYKSNIKFGKNSCKFNFLKGKGIPCPGFD